MRWISNDFESDIDVARLQTAGFGRQIGLGTSPAALVIDVQNHMLGREREDHPYSSSCGVAGRTALVRIQTLLDEARTRKLPIIYTRFVLDGPIDMGIYGLKRAYQSSTNWCIQGTPGAEIAEDVEPQQGDLVVDKKKPSAFFGTSLLSYLVQTRIDTLIIVGGATSSFVRATVMDAMSYNLRPIVVEDCVFIDSRPPIS